MFNFARCPIQLKDVRSKRWGSGMILQTRSDVIMYPGCLQMQNAVLWKQNGICWSWNLASRYRKVFHGIKYNDYESTATMKRHSYSVWFFRVLCSQTGRIWKNSKNSKNYKNRRIIRTRSYLHWLLTPVTRHLKWTMCLHLMLHGKFVYAGMWLYTACMWYM